MGKLRTCKDTFDKIIFPDFRVFPGRPGLFDASLELSEKLLAKNPNNIFFPISVRGKFYFGIFPGYPVISRTSGSFWHLFLFYQYAGVIINFFPFFLALLCAKV